MAEPTLRVTDLKKSFSLGETTVEVLRGIGFELGRGESLVVTGPSGAGKSTLLHLLGGLDRPTDGRIEIEGREPYALAERELARFRNTTIGFVFQDPHLLPQYSVLENVLIPTMAFPRERPDDVDERAATLLDRVGLGHRLTHRPSELSGGERQRAAVARALINGPSVLLCDEPTGSLDGENARGVASLLFDLHRDTSTVLVCVTHSEELAARFDRRFELRDGRCSER